MVTEAREEGSKQARESEGRREEGERDRWMDRS